MCEPLCRMMCCLLALHHPNGMMLSRNLVLSSMKRTHLNPDHWRCMHGCFAWVGSALQGRGGGGLHPWNRCPMCIDPLGAWAAPSLGTLSVSPGPSFFLDCCTAHWGYCLGEHPFWVLPTPFPWRLSNANCLACEVVPLECGQAPWNGWDLTSLSHQDLCQGFLFFYELKPVPWMSSICHGGHSYSQDEFNANGNERNGRKP